MIIHSSQISMDASSGHKDVSKSADGRILSRNHSGKHDQSFSLKLPLPEFSREKNYSQNLQATQQAQSSINNKEGSPSRFNTEYVLAEAIEALTGSKAQLANRRPLDFPAPLLDRNPFAGSPSKRFYLLGGQQFSMNFSAHRLHYEYEFIDFSSSGEIQTADGRTISFSFDLSIHRSSMIKESVVSRVSAGYFTDPLVLHFGSGLDRIDEGPFWFDMNNDGSPESIPALNRGSGFLALDKNGDNVISNGFELFGPMSGSGFSDLSVHDHDDNKWIDENDPIFESLLVWLNPSGKEQQLISLREAGVGAISLTNAGTLFNLKSGGGGLLGQITASGIFLTEDGQVKSLQDLNLANLNENNQPDDGLITNRNPEIERSLSVLKEMISAHRRTLQALADQHRFGLLRKPDEEELRWRFLKDHDDLSAG